MFWLEIVYHGMIVSWIGCFIIMLFDGTCLFIKYEVNTFSHNIWMIVFHLFDKQWKKNKPVNVCVCAWVALTLAEISEIWMQKILFIQLTFTSRSWTLSIYKIVCEYILFNVILLFYSCPRCTCKNPFIDEHCCVLFSITLSHFQYCEALHLFS